VSETLEDNDSQEPVNVDRSLSISEVAARLELSERTIRRRIKDGSLQAFQRPTSRGYEWRILLEAEPGQELVNVDRNDRQAESKDRQEPVNVDTGAEPAEPPAAELGLLKALDMVEALQQENTRLQEENKQLYGQAAFYQAKLQAAEERILMLEARPVEEETEQSEPPAELEKPSGSWWRRFLGWRR